MDEVVRINREILKFTSFYCPKVNFYGPIYGLPMFLRTEAIRMNPNWLQLTETVADIQFSGLSLLSYLFSRFIMT